MASKYRGFTLIELMVTIAIAAILMMIGIPSMTSMYEGHRSDSGVKSIVQSLMFARNQAVSYGSRITVCPLSNNACSSDWKNGYTIFTDNGTPQSIDGTDQIIRVIDKFNSNDFVTISADFVSFTSDGFISSGAEINITYCPGSLTSDNKQGARVSVSGLTSLMTPSGSCS